MYYPSQQQSQQQQVGQYQQQQTQRFPYTQALDYSSIQSIIQAYPHLQHINRPLSQSCPNAKNNNILTGVVIRSANDDNVHKAIKYGIWTTTVKNRTKLNQLYIKSKSQNKDIYLFFSVVKSGMFQAVAKLKSGLIQDLFPYWWEDSSHKFKDYFKIQWVYIKDVNFYHFDRLLNTQNQQVSTSKDCDLVDSQTTYKMLQIISNKPIKNKWIFNDFAFMDTRQKQYTRRSQSPYQYSYGMANNYGYDYTNAYNNNNMNMMGYMNMNMNMGMNMNMNNMGYNMGYMNMNMGTTEQSIPLPPQMLRPVGPDTNTSARGDLGFQKNPVSRNRKR